MYATLKTNAGSCYTAKLTGTVTIAKYGNFGALVCAHYPISCSFDKGCVF